MRQASLRWYYTMVTIMLLTMLGCVIQNGSGSRWTGIGMKDASSPVSIQAILDITEPIADNPDFTIRASIIPSSNNGFIEPRQDSPPVWERILRTKQTGPMVGFFYAIMVISMFFIFYRSSRNGSGNDDDSEVCYKTL